MGRNSCNFINVMAAGCMVTILLLGIECQVLKGSTKKTIYKPPKEGSSAQGWYKHAGIAADSEICGQIAKDILRKNGSVVDAGIAAQLCNGVVDQPHMGIGGSSISLVYASPRHGGPKELVYISGDDRCPNWISKNVFNGVANWDEPYMIVSEEGNKIKTFDYRVLAMGIPGELAGYYTAWERYGRLPWADVVEPSIQLARNGYKLTKIVETVLSEFAPVILSQPSLYSMYTKSPGAFYSEGDVLTDSVLASTLEQIAEDPLSFYHGQLADDIIDDITEHGAKITKSDMENYQPRIMKPIEMSVLGGKYKAFVPGTPFGGELFVMAYNIMDGYNMTTEDISTPEGMVLFYHRFLEAWKFAHSHIGCIADGAAELSSKCERLLKTIVTKEYADTIRAIINDNHVQSSVDNYLLMDKLFNVELHGTSHLNIIAEDGAAFLSTSSINTELGSRFKGTKTGIIFNNRLNDFTRTSDTGEEFPEEELNYPGPDRQALSFRMPFLVLNEDGKPVLAIGSSGGARIMMAVMQDMMMHLHFNLNLKDAIDFPRMVLKLIAPAHPVFHDNFGEEFMDIFKSKGHAFVSQVYPTFPYTAVTQGVSTLACLQCEECDDTPCIEAVSDHRKGGAPAGY